MARPHRRVCCGVHAAPRHHGSQRCAARHPEGAAHLLHRSSVGRGRVRAHPRGDDAQHRLARRPARPQAGVPGCDRALHHRLDPLRHSAIACLVDHRARRAGDRRRGHVRRLARDHLAGVPRAGARDGVRDLGRDRRDGGRDRAARRRRVDDLRRVALDLLRQHPDRRSVHRGWAAGAARDARRGARGAGPPRARDPHVRAVRTGARTVAR